MCKGDEGGCGGGGMSEYEARCVCEVRNVSAVDRKLIPVQGHMRWWCVLRMTMHSWWDGGKFRRECVGDMINNLFKAE